jgi:hypothetical protein
MRASKANKLAMSHPFYYQDQTAQFGTLIPLLIAINFS